MKSFTLSSLIKIAALGLAVGFTVACQRLPLEYPPPPVVNVPLQSGALLTAKGVGTMTDRGLRLTLDAVFFDVDKATLRPDGVRKVGEFVDLIQQNNSRLVYVEGHTDDTGDAAYNQNLSERRANSVRNALITKNIAAERLIAKGYGETQPIANNKTKEGRQQNRRVEILISNDVVNSKAPPVFSSFCTQHPKLSWKKCDFSLVEEKL